MNSTERMPLNITAVQRRLAVEDILLLRELLTFHLALPYSEAVVGGPLMESCPDDNRVVIMEYIQALAFEIAIMMGRDEDLRSHPQVMPLDHAGLVMNLMMEALELLREASNA